MTGICVYDLMCLNASYETENNKYPAAVVAKINTSTIFGHLLRKIFLLRSLISNNNRHSRHANHAAVTGIEKLV
jgi:hypothetical protein